MVVLQCFCRNLPTKIEFKSMSEYNQAEDIKILMEKVKEKNYFFSLLKSEINKVIIGQEYMIDRLLIGLLGNGHVLLEGCRTGEDVGDKNTGRCCAGTVLQNSVYTGLVAC